MGQFRTIKMELSSDIRFLRPVHEFVSQLLETLEFAEREKMHVALTVSELMTNAIYYGNKKDADKKISLIFEIHDNKLVFRIRDQGPGFDLDKIRLEEKNLSASADHGRGIFLVDSYMDEISHRIDADGFEIEVSKHKTIETKGEGPMDIQVNKLDNTTVLVASGKLDSTSTPVLKDAIKALIAENRSNIILDMENVPFINSTGLGTLVGILKELRGIKGSIRLCTLQPYVQELFEVTQLVKVFQIYDDQEAAKSSLNQN